MKLSSGVSFWSVDGDDSDDEDNVQPAAKLSVKGRKPEVLAAPPASQATTKGKGANGLAQDWTDSVTNKRKRDADASFEEAPSQEQHESESDLDSGTESEMEVHDFVYVCVFVCGS